MNCKPGELALVKSDREGFHTGKIVTVTSIDPFFDVPAWFTDPPLRDPDNCLYSPSDCNLRPIRDNDGEDETLTWAGLPHKEHA